jgi:hypothetical protein
MPLKVYIEENAAIKGFKPEFATLLRQSFNDWANASGGRVSFVFTDQEAGAQIKCRWTSKAEFNSKGELGGKTELTANLGYNASLHSAKIVLHTLIDNKATTDQILKTAKQFQLHEIGHALGMGHSQKSYDIMFYRCAPEGLEFPLSERDKRTITLLYAHPPNDVIPVQEKRRTASNAITANKNNLSHPVSPSASRSPTRHSGWYSEATITKAVDNALSDSKK